MQIAILTYDRMTALDAVGPHQVLTLLPGAEAKWVAANAGPVLTDSGLYLVADATFGDVPHPDIILVPGGLDVSEPMRDPQILDWIRLAHETSTWTTSVCTGALILGAAGVLRGLKATTHWAVLHQLRDLGAEPVGERVVQQGKVVTGAGVSAGIDMALRLAELIAGAEIAQTIQLCIEYDPQPPFDAGSPARATPQVKANAMRALSGAISRTEAAQT
jgi:transcriptional regulator GlxA family with amidase domain